MPCFEGPRMAYKLAMGKFSHIAERRGRDDDDEDDFDRLPRKGLGNVPPHLSVKYYRMDKVKSYMTLICILCAETALLLNLAKILTRMIKFMVSLT